MKENSDFINNNNNKIQIKQQKTNFSIFRVKLKF